MSRRKQDNQQEQKHEHGQIPRNDEICNKIMSEEQFKELKAVIGATSYSKGKLNVMKQSIKFYGITSSQTNELIQLLSFRRDKLALTNFSDTYINDKE